MTDQSNKKNKEKSISIILICLILSFVVVLTIAVYNGIIKDDSIDNDDVKVEATLQTMSYLESIIELFRIHQLHYPKELKELTNSFAKAPNGYILKKNLCDAWGNEFIYEISSLTYMLKSYGADGKDGGKDYNEDIVRVVQIAKGK